MNKPYQTQYYNITKRLINNPNKIGDSRIGKINSRFVEQIRVDLTKEFPLQDIKKIKFSNIVHELLWMIKGDTNIKYLIGNECHIWTDDAYRYFNEKYSLQLNLELTKDEFIEKVLNGDTLKYNESKDYVFGDLDRIYGQQWRNFNGKTDQLENCINTLKTNPDDRRMIVTAHNPTDIEENNVGLPSCHNYFQFYTTKNNDGSRNLSTFVNIRSNDFGLGNPYNVAQYALLTHIIAKIVGMKVNELVINSVDTHLYHEHFDGMKIWMKRFENILEDNSEYSGDFYDILGCSGKLKLKDIGNINNIKASDIELVDYNPQSNIKMNLLT